MLPDWVVSETFIQRAADRYGKGHFPERVLPIEAVIVHYTGPGTAPGARRWLTQRDDVYLSAHFVIDRDGKTWQLVSLNERAIHAGGPTSRLFGRGNVNGRTIGIELANAGPLVLGVDGRFYDDLGRRFEGAVAHAAGSNIHPHWEAYPSRQIESLCSLIHRLGTLIPLIRDEPLTRIVGHQDVDPSRKRDPGPVFPWILVRQATRGNA